MSEFGDPLELDIGINADPAQARRVAEQLALVIETALVRAFDRIRDQLNAALSGTTAKNALRGFNQAASKGFEATEKEIDQLSNGMQALVRRSRAFRQELSTRGIDQSLFASYEHALAEAIQAQQRFQANREQIAKDPTARLAAEAELKHLNTILRTETQNATRILEEEHGRQIVEAQRSLTLTNTQQRLAGARQLAAEQSRSRARIELFRFTARQILFIERELSRALRGLAGFGADIGRSLIRGVGSIGRLLRRNNSEFNEGLQGALSRREQTISRSFERQNQVIRNQSKTIEQLQQKTSTGLAGLLSGRSATAGALGIGGLLGGGLLGGGLLRSGLDRFTQLERINIQLNRLTGSAKETERILDAITKLARETPLELTDLSQAAVGLLAAGTGLKELVPFVQSLADAIGFTGGGPEQLQRVALALRQIASIGRLQGEELRQLAESLPGLNIPQLLADQLTEGDTALLLKLSEAGEISASEFSEAFATALSSDPRIVGAATATVNTLGGQIAILKETFSDLGRAVIQALEPFLRFSIQGTIRRLQFFTQLIDGGTTPALRALRTALIGVAAGLAAIVAAKGAIEVLSLLGTAARGLVTPLGLLVASFAAIGAAVAVLRVTNPAFRDLTDSLIAFTSSAVVTGLSRLGTLIADLAQRLFTQGLPALTAFAVVLASKLAPVIQAVAGLVVNVFIPALVSFASFISSQFLPAVSRVGSAIAGVVIPALETLGHILADVIRFLDPAIQGFASLGRAIINAFQGDFSGLLGGLRDVGVGLGTVFANLGVLLFNAIRPQIERVRDLISGVLGRIDLTAVVVSISKVARQIGFVIGNIATDPRLIQALEKIVLAAALIGGRLAQGLIEGALSNLPALVDMFVGQLVGLLQSGLLIALNNPRILLAALGAFLFGDIVVNFIRNIGKNWGKITADGVVKGFRSSAKNFQTGVQSFFAGAERVRARVAAQTRRNTINEFQRLARDIQALGAKPGAGGAFNFRESQIDRVGVRQLQTQFKELTRDMDESSVRALVARGQFARLGEGFRQVGTAIRQTFQRDFQSAGVSFRTGLRQMQLSLRDWAADLRARGTTLGQTLGAGILGGIAAAFSASQGGTIGVVGALTAVLATGLSAGPIAAAVAATGAGIGLLINKFRENGEAVQFAREQIAQYVNTLKDFNNVAAATPALAEQLTDTLLAQGTEAQAILQRSGFNVPAFIADVTAGQANLATTIRGLTDGLNVDTRRIQAFVESEDALGRSTGQALEDLDKAARGRTSTNQAEALIQEIQKAGLDTRAFVELLRTLNEQSGFVLAGVKENKLRQQLLDAGDAAAETQIRLSGLNQQLTDLNKGGRGGALTILDRAQLQNDTRSTLDQVLGIFGDFKVNAQDLFKSVVEFARENQIQIDFSFLQTLIDGLKNVVNGFKDAGEASDDYFERLGQLNVQEDILAANREQRRKEHQKLLSDTVKDLELVKAAVDELNRQRTDQLNLRIKFLQDQLEGAREAADRAREAFTNFLTGGFSGSPERLVDELVGNLDDIGSRLEEGIANGGLRGDALARLALGDFEDALAQILQKGFERGLRTPEQFRTLLNPLFGALDEEGRDALARILSTSELDQGVGPTAISRLKQTVERALNAEDIQAAVGAIFDADAEVERIQEQLDRTQAELDITARFDAEQVKAALQAAGINPELLMVITPELVQAQQEGTELADIVAKANEAIGTSSIPGGTIVNQNVTVVSQPGQEAAAGRAIIDAQNAAVAGRPIVNGRPLVGLGASGFRN